MKIQPLSPSTVFGVAAPASAPTDLSLITEGIRYLQSLGYQIHPATSYSPFGYLSGTDQQRTLEFNNLLWNSSIDIILCVRGGYGSLRILDEIDYAALIESPKLIVGYSDITAIQLAVLARTGLPSVSGPMVAIEWADKQRQSDESVWNLLRGAMPDPVVGPSGEALQSVKEGTAIGPIIGGNLSVLCKMVGTPFLPDLTGAILFVEEVSELPYQVDGLLAQLRLAGVLDQIAGLIFGELTPPDKIPDRPSLTYAQVIESYADYVHGPVATNLQYGHIASKIAMPIGVNAMLTVYDSEALLTILEPVVDIDPNRSTP